MAFGEPIVMGRLGKGLVKVHLETLLEFGLTTRGGITHHGRSLIQQYHLVP